MNDFDRSTLSITGHWALILLVGLVLCCGIAAIVSTSNSEEQIEYLRRQMDSGWKETLTNPQTLSDGLIGVSLGNAWKQYETARSQLVELGVLKHAKYRFRNLRTSSEAHRALLQSLLKKSRASLTQPPVVDWAIPHNPGELDEMEMWGEPLAVDQLLMELAASDTAEHVE